MKKVLFTMIFMLVATISYGQGSPGSIVLSDFDVDATLSGMAQIPGCTGKSVSESDSSDTVAAVQVEDDWNILCPGAIPNYHTWGDVKASSVLSNGISAAIGDGTIHASHVSGVTANTIGMSSGISDLVLTTNANADPSFTKHTLEGRITIDIDTTNLYSGTLYGKIGNSWVQIYSVPEGFYVDAEIKVGNATHVYSYPVYQEKYKRTFNYSEIIPSGTSNSSIFVLSSYQINASGGGDTEDSNTKQSVIITTKVMSNLP